MLHSLELLFAFAAFSREAWEHQCGGMSGLSSPAVTEKSFSAEGAGPCGPELSLGKVKSRVSVSILRAWGSSFRSRSFADGRATHWAPAWSFCGDWIRTLEARWTTSTQTDRARHGEACGRSERWSWQPCWEAQRGNGGSSAQQGPAMQADEKAAVSCHLPQALPLQLSSPFSITVPPVRSHCPLWAVSLEAGSVGMWAPTLTFLLSGCPVVSAQMCSVLRCGPPAKMGARVVVSAGPSSANVLVLLSSWGD